MAQKLFVGGLSFSTTDGGLREFFSQAGAVMSATVVTDRDTGRSRGFGFVEMTTAEEAERAVVQLGGRVLDGRQIRVEVSRPKAEGGSRRTAFSGRGGWR